MPYALTGIFVSSSVLFCNVLCSLCELITCVFMLNFDFCWLVFLFQKQIICCLVMIIHKALKSYQKHKLTVLEQIVTAAERLVTISIHAVCHLCCCELQITNTCYKIDLRNWRMNERRRKDSLRMTWRWQRRRKSSECTVKRRFLTIFWCT